MAQEKSAGLLQAKASAALAQAEARKKARLVDELGAARRQLCAQISELRKREEAGGRVPEQLRVLAARLQKSAALRLLELDDQQARRRGDGGHSLLPRHTVTS